MPTGHLPQPWALIRHPPVRQAAMPVAIGLFIWLISATPAHAYVQQIHEWREPGGTGACSQLPPGPQDGVLLAADAKRNALTPLPR